MGNAKEVNASSVDETKLNLDVKLYDPNDSIEYKVIIKNSSFDTRKVTSFKRMFNGANNLRHIYVGENWDISHNTGEIIYVFSASAQYLPNYDTTNPDRQKLENAKLDTEGGYLTLKINDENP